MTTIKRILLIIVLAAAAALPSQAYEVSTHRQMTEIAVRKSLLYTDPSIMLSLGLLRPGLQEFQYYQRTGNIRTGLGNLSVPGFMGEGAVEEDDGTAPFNHFYDPVHNRAILPIFYRSWEWMLEQEAISGQENSLSDARFYLSYGLMHTDADANVAYQQRLLAMSWLIRTMGHVMHHMQDMAQPQHVRHDQHVPPIFRSRYETYTAEHNEQLRPFMEQASAVFPGSLDFGTARDFWFNGANTGIAQTTNRDFLSHGTNFRMTPSGATTSGDFALPQPEGSTDYTVAQAYAAGGESVPAGIQNLCGLDGVDCTMTMYSTTLSQRASTYSVFNQDLIATGVEPVYNGIDGYTYKINRFFDLNHFNFDDVHPWVITRAVSYSAGIVNHFFRGRLEVSKPSTGPYSAVDHSTGEGFRKIRVTVKNVTPQEALGGGTIRLIAKYHLNNCYKPDLSGEFRRDAVTGALVTPCPNFRSPEEHLSVSLEQVASFDADQSKQFTFTLIDPIPQNATDLMFQVYYTGKVGVEEESFALGSVDVSEPTFMAVMNATDVFELSGAFYYWRDIVANIATPPYSIIDNDKNGIYNPPTDVNVTGGDMSFDITVNGMKVASAPAVPEGRFTRLSLIVDLNGFDHGLVARSPLFLNTGTDHFSAKVIQYDYDLNTTLVRTVAPLRNHTLQYMSSTLHAYHPAHSANIATMPKSMMPSAELPFPQQLTAGVLLGVAPTIGTTDAARAAAATPSGPLARMWEQEQSGSVPREVLLPVTNSVTALPDDAAPVSRAIPARPPAERQ